VIGCFASKGRFWLADTLKGVVGTCAISVLPDDWHTYLNAHNIHFTFFFLHFWIVCGSGCL